VDPDSKRLPPQRPRGAAERSRTTNRGLTVVVSDGRGRRLPDGGLGRWLASVAPARARGEVAVALVTDAHVRSLNRRYRRKDAPTDVLSFPSSDSLPGDQPKPRAVDRSLGDIVIARGVAERQAREGGHSYQTELRVLALHGLLHLLGFDHEDPDDAGRMARLEARLRRKGRLAAGLIERSKP
jgi:probable rRNA maturation factor